MSFTNKKALPEIEQKRLRRFWRKWRGLDFPTDVNPRVVLPTKADSMRKSNSVIDVYP